jgi:hypothetical protein
MALDVGGITYVHAIQYFEKGIDSQGPFYNVEYHIDDWADSDDFVNYLLGLGATSPHRYALSPNLACTQAVAVGKGRPTLGTDGTPAYADGAIIKATYRSGGSTQGGATTNLLLDDPGLQHQIDSSTPLVYCTQELDFGTEPIHFGADQHKLVWNTGGTPAKVPFQVDVAVTTLVLTFHRRSYLPMTQVRNLRGKINSSTFLGATAETVIFLGAKTTREWSTDGRIEQKVQLTFKERAESWNKFLRPDAASITWDYVKAADNTRRYQTADLTPLVQI